MIFQRELYTSIVFIFSLVIFFTHTVTADPLDNWHLRNDWLGFPDLNGVSYGNGTFIAVGSGGTILTSSDGVNWTERNSGITKTLKGVAYGNNTFVSIGDNKIILNSPDGIHWTSLSETANTKMPELDLFKLTSNFLVGEAHAFCMPVWGEGLKRVFFGNGTFVAVGDNELGCGNLDGLIKTSSDGKKLDK